VLPRRPLKLPEIKNCRRRDDAERLQAAEEAMEHAGWLQKQNRQRSRAGPSLRGWRGFIRK